MDDLERVRDAYGAVATDDRMKARIRARLTDDAVARPARRRGLPRGRRTGAIVTVATAAAATAGVALLGSGGGGGPGKAPGAVPAELSARTILLTAADKAAAEPQGRYWRLHEVVGSTGRVEGANPYTVLSPSEFDGWRAVSDQGTDVTYQRDLASSPLAAADKEAWKRAGSPATFRVRNNADWITYRRRDGAWTEQRATPADKRNAAKACASRPALLVKCGGNLTWAQREKLAKDPKQFQKLLFPPTLPGATLSPANKLQRGFDFLVEQPVSPAVRAKAFRVLADLPGVRSTGRVKAPDGRAGISVTAEGKMIDGSGATFAYQLILDPKTYAIVGDRETIVGGTYRGLGAGTLLNQDSVLQVGWTGQAPHHA